LTVLTTVTLASTNSAFPRPTLVLSYL